MKIPVFILTAFLGAIFALQGWMLVEITDLKADVAAIKAVVKINQFATAKIPNEN